MQDGFFPRKAEKIELENRGAGEQVTKKMLSE